MAGLVAGIIATLVMLGLSIVANGISLPEVVGSQLTALMPASVFDYLHETIGADAKHYLFDGIVVGQCLVFALSGALYNLFLASSGKVTAKQSSSTSKQQENTALQASETKLQLYHGVLLAGLLWLLVGFIFLPLMGAGIFGAWLSIGFINSVVSLAVVGASFGLLFVPLRNWFAARPEKVRASRVDAGNGDEVEGGLSRRTILKRGFVIAGVGLLGIGAWRFITQGVNTTAAPVSHLIQHFKSKIVPPPIPNYGEIHPTKFLSPEITSNDQFYIVSKNLFSDPVVGAGLWQLSVDGYVDHPFTLTYDELLALPMQQQYESMMCVSNEVGGQYMSNALWEGVPLRQLLQRAGVKAGAIKVVFYAVDGYSDSIHLDKALEPTTLLAVRMNGAILPQSHGFPARMLVPGIYGMKHCKWLTRIEVVKDNYQGYWQQRGWSDAAPIRMTARIDTPLIGVNVPVNQTTNVAGVAFSGNKGISEVDVSLDAGKTWQRATLKRPLSDLTWVLWEYLWQPTTRGTYTLVVRATDGDGKVQEFEESRAFTSGITGFHKIIVHIFG